MCLTMRKTAGGKSKKEELLTCNSSACPARLLLCLVRRFINRTNRGGPDGCYDTIICFRGSPSSSWALFCCLFAACRSSPPATHTRAAKVNAPHLTRRWYLRVLSIISSWDHPSRRSIRKGVLHCVSVCVCTHAHART